MMMPAAVPLPSEAVAPPAGWSARSTQSVPAVQKVFVILEVLARSQNGLTIRQLAAICGLPKSSVHCIIVTLERCGYLHRNPRTSRYLFGRKLLMLANSALSGLELCELAEPHLRALARRTRLPVHLAIVELDEAVIVAKSGFPSPGIRVGTWVGKRMELHCTAVGKALITDWGEAEIARLARERTLSRHNDNTIWTVKKLLDELASVRRLGYAVDDEEDVLGSRCIGAPVYDGAGKVAAAISVSGTISDITAENIARLAAEVLAEAGALRQSLAGRCCPAPLMPR